MRHHTEQTILLNDGVKWYLDNPNVQVFLSFTVNIIASHLKKIRYSPYQQELWEIIKDKTPRGHVFKNTHVFSILKKKRIADERMEKKNQYTITNLELKIKICKYTQLLFWSNNKNCIK